MKKIDRTELSRRLAKAIAYKQCGQDAKAALWAAALVQDLGLAGILNAETMDALETADRLHEMDIVTR